MNLKYCDIRSEFQFVYFTITIIYIFIIMLIPIVLIFVCNLLIIMGIFYASKKRKLHLNESFSALRSRSTWEIFILYFLIYFILKVSNKKRNGSTIRRYNKNACINQYFKSVRFDEEVEMTGMAEINPITSIQDYSQTQSVALKNVLKKADYHKLV